MPRIAPLRKTHSHQPPSQIIQQRISAKTNAARLSGGPFKTAELLESGRRFLGIHTHLPCRAGRDYGGEAEVGPAGDWYVCLSGGTTQPGSPAGTPGLARSSGGVAAPIDPLGQSCVEGLQAAVELTVNDGQMAKIPAGACSWPYPIGVADSHPHVIVSAAGICSNLRGIAWERVARDPIHRDDGLSAPRAGGRHAWRVRSLQTWAARLATTLKDTSGSPRHHRAAACARAGLAALQPTKQTGTNLRPVKSPEELLGLLNGFMCGAATCHSTRESG